MADPPRPRRPGAGGRVTTMRPSKTYGQMLDELEKLLEPFRRSVPVSEPMPHDIRTALVFIHENLFSPDLDVQQLKRRCRIGDNNISSRFRCRLGQTIKVYIESKRMKAAAHVLVQEPEMRVYDVAQAVGYDSPQTFYRAFARQFECTPTDYRNQAGPQ